MHRQIFFSWSFSLLLSISVRSQETILSTLVQMFFLPDRTYYLIDPVDRLTSQAYRQIWIYSRAFNRLSYVLSFCARSESYIKVRANASTPAFSSLAWSWSHINKIALNGVPFGFACLLTGLYVIFVKIGIGLVDRFLRRLYHKIGSACMFPRRCVDAFGIESESEYIFMRVDEGKRWVFAILYDF